jgi:isoleucyl-tRNA synthetase
VPEAWADQPLADKWAKVRRVRRVVTGALEVERAAKRIGSGLQAHPTVHVTDPELAAAIADVDLAEVCITSAVTVAHEPAPDEAYTLEEVPGVAVVPGLADGQKCQRCWQVLPEVGGDPKAPETCQRCADAVHALGAAAE